MTDQALDSMLRRVLLDVDCQQYGEAIDELPECDFSPVFEKKMQKLIRRADHPIRYRVAQAVACLLLAALLSGCTALAISPEVRAAFVGWVREVYESWFVYRYTGEEQPTPENTVYFPTWVPDGYEEIVAPQAGTFVRTQYENNKKDLLTISYLKGTETSTLNVEWDKATVQQSLVGNLPADLYLNPDDGPNILVWTDTEKDVAFWITAPLAEEELVRIAESIQGSAPMPKRYCVTWLPLNYGGYYIASEMEVGGTGETVYENDFGFSITFGYSNDTISAPYPDGTASSAYVGDQEAELYSALKEGGDKTLIWTTEDGDILWVQAPLPDEELIQIAENVIVKLSRFTDLMDMQVFDGLDDLENNLLPLVEQTLTDSFVAEVEDCARRDAQAGTRMSEEFNQLWKEQEARCISPNREDAIVRVSALVDALNQEGRQGESIISLFGPFYTASIMVNYYNTYAYICDEQGVVIAYYDTINNPEWIMDPTAEEMQFEYAVNVIYSEAYKAAKAELAQE